MLALIRDILCKEVQRWMPARCMGAVNGMAEHKASLAHEGWYNLQPCLSLGTSHDLATDESNLGPGFILDEFQA